ncbi:MAG TPA: response regulator [Patescibacteria group bacterium]|nr:response regulator [Patescibacteria group bacterium]
MKSILIIEDHVGLRESYQILFNKEGFEVEMAEDGKMGLDMALKKVYDVILLDMLMPVMDGITFLRAYKPLKHPKSKIIAFSNLQTSDIVKESVELGVKRYITKSITPPREMAKTVKDVISKA